MNLTGAAVEVGTNARAFTIEFMDRWLGRQLACLGPFGAGLSRDTRATKRALLKHSSRVLVLGKSPGEAVHDFPLNSLDFVYFGGNNTAVVGTQSRHEDVMRWADKVKPGGIIAGYDFSGYYGNSIHAATEEMSASWNSELFRIPGAIDSWYTVKPEGK
jgi:hypothetical protein